MAEGRAVDFFVGVSLSASIDDQPAGPGQWRVDETPGADLVHPRHAATGALAQGDAAAIAPGGAQRQTGQVLRRVLAHQIAIEDKAAAAQQHRLFGANQLANGAGLFDATLTGAQAVGQRRGVHMNGRGPA
ncbi:hypothetical protein D3C81_1621980 [compost metagenome]